MLWLNFLHFYQPPTASDEQIRDIIKSCYQSWADFLLTNKKVKVTVNLTACLTERLFQVGYQKLLNQFACLAERKQIEFVESAAFHPILPLLPDQEIIKQIKINHDINSRHLCPAYQPRGFFPPEMAYSQKLAFILERLKYQYLILDQIALDGTLKTAIDPSVKYKIKKTKLTVVFRDRRLSQTFIPEKIQELFSGNYHNNQILITATDGELYGHRHWNWWPGYQEIIKNKQVQTATLGEYLKNIKKTQEVSLRPSSWESSPSELRAGHPFALWLSPNNKIQKQLWQLANFALELNYQYKKDPNHFASRLHLERGLASCTFWWASGRDFALFDSPAWNPSEIEKGAQELIFSIRSLANVSAKNKIKAELVFSALQKNIWLTHWRAN